MELFVMPPWHVVVALAALVVILALAVKHGCAAWNAKIERELDAVCADIRAIVDPSGSHAAARDFNAFLPAARDRLLGDQAQIASG